MIKYIQNICLTGSTLLLLSCGQNSDSGTQESAPIAVTDYTVVQQEVTGIDVYPATVVPLNELEIRPQVSGYITQIYVKDGQTVVKGQKLYEIDRSKYIAAKNAAQAALASAEASLTRITKDVARYERLYEQEAIATQILDNAKAELLTTQAQVNAAKAQLESAQTDLAYSELKAPFAGRIGISQVRLGAQVSPGQPLLNTLSSDDPILVDFVINEREIPRFNRLMKGENLPDSLFTVKLSDGSKYPFVGKINAIDRAVGRNSGTINIRVEFPNPERDLVPGMTVNLQVINQDYGQQLVIPYKAVTEQMGEYFVYVINENGEVRQQNLQLGTLLGANIVVRDGLKAGQRIVVDGIQKLREGAKVSTDDSTAAQ